jgi:hypothetical protein
MSEIGMLHQLTLQNLDSTVVDCPAVLEIRAAAS